MEGSGTCVCWWSLGLQRRARYVTRRLLNVARKPPTSTGLRFIVKAAMKIVFHFPPHFSTSPLQRHFWNDNNNTCKYRLNYPVMANVSVGEEEEQARERSRRVRRQNIGDESKRNLKV
ncbi:hypothetical protein E2C01_032827 [Portunus trituberculatus]|uniref:Uncharacterized protein n=1 Tax=Portunus trituberculatus TaxID=210409 RepID=A0A5B7F1S5_PORTR|nr:hypothetical protein [Portunus trituberculatus]